MAFRFRSYKLYLKPKPGVSLLSYLARSSKILTYRANPVLPLNTSVPSNPLCSDQGSRSLMPSNSRGFHTSISLFKILGRVICMRYPHTWPKETSGIIVKWYKEEGDIVYPGDLLIKINKDISVFYDYSYNARYGKIMKILVPADTDVETGHFIALIMEPQWGYEIPSDFELPVIPPPLPAFLPKRMYYRDPWADYGQRDFHPRFVPERKVYRDDHGLPGTPATDRLLGPAVRNTLRLYGLTFNQVPLSGGFRNMTKGDIFRLVHVLEMKPLDPDDQAPVEVPVLSSRIQFSWDVLPLIQEENLKPVEAGDTVTDKDASTALSKSAFEKKEAAGPYLDIEVTNMRRTTAKRLLQSKSTIPHAYATVDSRINHILALRNRMKNSGLKVSVNDFIIKSVANALVTCPGINITLEGDNVVQKGQIDISVAVATAVATDNGLITPIVTDVAGKDILQISEIVKELADRAKRGKLQPNEFMGGTFTISNLGMFGIHHFSAIINPPQCAILAVGGAHSYLDANGCEETRLQTTLSYDARAISDVNAAKFLAHLKHELENPSETSMGIYDIQGRVDIQDLAAS